MESVVVEGGQLLSGLHLSLLRIYRLCLREAFCIRSPAFLPSHENHERIDYTVRVGAFNINVESPLFFS
jgi:hypothetical protein